MLSSNTNLRLRLSLKFSHPSQHILFCTTYRSNLIFKLYVSRIGFDAIAMVVTSEKKMEPEMTDESKILNALQYISEKTLREYSGKIIGNSGSANNFGLELDQHVITSMQKMMSLSVVRDTARTDYIKYLLSYHICQLVENEFEKFHFQTSEKYDTYASSTPASFPRSESSSHSSQISLSFPSSLLSPSGESYSTTTSSSLTTIGSTNTYDKKIDIKSSKINVQAYHTALSDLDLLALDCLAHCLELSTKFRTHSEHLLKLKLSLTQINECSTAFSQSDQYSCGLAGHVLHDMISDKTFLKNNMACVGGNIFERNSRYVIAPKSCSDDAIIFNVLDRKRKFEHSLDKYDS